MHTPLKHKFTYISYITAAIPGQVRISSKFQQYQNKLEYLQSFRAKAWNTICWNPVNNKRGNQHALQLML